MNRIRLTAAIALGLTAVSMDAVSAQSPAPSALAGVYVLERVGTSALPATIEVEGDCREDVVSATLTLNANGTWRVQSVERDICGSKTDEDNEDESGRYRVNGSTIEFLDDDGDSQREQAGDDVEDLADGTVDGNVLRIKLGKSSTMLQFRRQ